MRTVVKSRNSLRAGLANTALLLVTAALTAAGPAQAAGAPTPLALADRLTWGATQASVADIRTAGLNRWVEQQLRDPGTLPPAAQAQIAAMRITAEPMAALVVETDAEDRAAKALTDLTQRAAAQKIQQQRSYALGREAQVRTLLRQLYASDQLREQMTWFWMNHFNVQQGKRDVRAIIGDYEATVRGLAFGRFRDLLGATVHHPAMLRYLDNADNAKAHINENYARELMELHTLGVGSGYSQSDVQELARILTGVGINLKPEPAKLKPEQQALYVRAGIFEFNPARHDMGDKHFLGHTIKGSGLGEVEQALDLLAAAPATAHHVSQQLATFWVGDNPPPALVERLTATFMRSRGDMAAVMRTLVRSPEFAASLGHDFKDPAHFVVSAVRAAYEGRVVLNPVPMIGWEGRLGEGLYERETPDGYPLASAAWQGPGQMELRFEIARIIGSDAAGLFTPVNGKPEAAFPQLQTPLYFDSRRLALAPRTRASLDQTRTPQEWNALFLSSPEFMQR